MRRYFILAALLAIPSHAHAQAIPKTLSCAGVFAKDTSHARLAAVFGASNVRFMKVQDVHDEVTASVVYPRDARKRLEFHWSDVKGRKQPNSIRIPNGNSIWKTANGIGMGTPLDRILQLHGKPISIMGFGHEVSGRVGFGEGALRTLPGGCTLSLHLGEGPGVPQDAMQKVMGESEFSSDDPNMRALNLRVSILAIEWQH